MRLAHRLGGRNSECVYRRPRGAATLAALGAAAAVEKKLYLAPRLAGDFRSFLACEGGYGTVGLRDGKPFFEPRSGSVEIREIVFTPAAL